MECALSDVVVKVAPKRKKPAVGAFIKFENGVVTLVVRPELRPRALLITVADDFRRYWRFRNQAIPLVILAKA